MGTLRLTVLRHGHAWPREAHQEDYERTLSPRGEAEAREMGARLVGRSLVPDLVVASSATRTRATASGLAAVLGLGANRLVLLDELYNASAAQIWQLLTSGGAWRVGQPSHVLVCGHNPGLSLLAGQFGPQPRHLDLPPAGLVTACWPQAPWESLEPGSATHSECLLPAMHSG